MDIKSEVFVVKSGTDIDVNPVVVVTNPTKSLTDNNKPRDWGYELTIDEPINGLTLSDSANILRDKLRIVQFGTDKNNNRCITRTIGMDDYNESSLRYVNCMYRIEDTDDDVTRQYRFPSDFDDIADNLVVYYTGKINRLPGNFPPIRISDYKEFIPEDLYNKATQLLDDKDCISFKNHKELYKQLEEAINNVPLGEENKRRLKPASRDQEKDKSITGTCLDEIYDILHVVIRQNIGSTDIDETDKDILKRPKIVGNKYVEPDSIMYTTYTNKQGWPVSKLRHDFEEIYDNEDYTLRTQLGDRFIDALEIAIGHAISLEWETSVNQNMARCFDLIFSPFSSIGKTTIFEKLLKPYTFCKNGSDNFTSKEIFNSLFILFNDPKDEQLLKSGLDTLKELVDNHKINQRFMHNESITRDARRYSFVTTNHDLSAEVVKAANNSNLISEKCIYIKCEDCDCDKYVPGDIRELKNKYMRQHENDLTDSIWYGEQGDAFRSECYRLYKANPGFLERYRGLAMKTDNRKKWDCSLLNAILYSMATECSNRIKLTIPKLKDINITPSINKFKCDVDDNSHITKIDRTNNQIITSKGQVSLYGLINPYLSDFIDDKKAATRLNIFNDFKSELLSYFKSSDCKNTLLPTDCIKGLPAGQKSDIRINQTILLDVLNGLIDSACKDEPEPPEQFPDFNLPY